jgi:hypothetical protein
MLVPAWRRPVRGGEDLPQHLGLIAGLVLFAMVAQRSKLVSLTPDGSGKKLISEATA